MNNSRKRRNRKHEGEYVWTYPQYQNKNGTIYHSCQYVLMENGKEKTVTRGLGVPGTTKYNSNLSKHEHLARESLIRRMRNAISAL